MLVPPGKAALNSAQAADFVMIPVPEGEKWAKIVKSARSQNRR